MAQLQLYARLVPSIDGKILGHESAVTIEDKVNEPCRVIVTSAIPSQGFEFDAHKAIGQFVKVGIHAYVSGRLDAAALLCEFDGRVVSAVTEKPCDCHQRAAKTTFVVEATGVAVPE